LTLPWQESPRRDLAHIGKPQDRALRIWRDGPVGPFGDKGPSGAVFGAGASYSVAYQRNHSRSRQPISAPAAELPIGCQHTPNASAGGFAARFRRGPRPVPMVRARQRASSSTHGIGTLQEVVARLAGAQRLRPCGMAGRLRLIGRRPACGTLPPPTPDNWHFSSGRNVDRGHAPCKFWTS
jgi:hypothetical protein